MDLRPSALVVNRTFTGSFVYLPLSPSITSNFVTATKVTQFPVFIAKRVTKLQQNKLFNKTKGIKGDFISIYKLVL